MVLMEKIYRIEDGETLTIITDKGKEAFCISKEKDKLKVKNIENYKKDDNVLIMTLDEAKFNHYKFMDSIYDILVKLTNNNEKDRKRLNNYMNELVKDLFGEQYTSKDIEIRELNYIAIANYEYVKK